ncbi:unnamed protein product [Urochloa decumbens]|uniref:Transcription factor TFIIB cyclin-like domain-containing protein n=1 Tax=Urochloa decumbens TaxID=240449 RepID=A0ABC9GLA0_9POAL
MSYPAPAEEAAAPPRMRGAVSRPHPGPPPPPRTTTEEGLALKRMRGTVTLSLGMPDEEPATALPLAGGAAAAFSLGTEAPPAPAALPPTMRGAVHPPREKASTSEGRRAITDMASKLGIAPGVLDRALEVFRRMEEAKGKSHHYYTKGGGRSGDALYAACIYVACRRAGAPRTFKELAAATRDGAAARKDIGRLITLIRRRLGDDEAAGGGGEEGGCGGGIMGMGVVRAADYMERFGARLGMGEEEVRAVQEAARRMQDQLDVRRNPDSTAAAIIYMAMERRPGAARSGSIKDVSAATGVADNTIKQAYRELYPHAQLLFG